MEFILEIVLLIVFVYPGAGIRWLFSRFWNSKKSFKAFLEDDGYLNGSVGILVVALIIITICQITGMKPIL